MNDGIRLFIRLICTLIEVLLKVRWKEQRRKEPGIIARTCRRHRPGTGRGKPPVTFKNRKDRNAGSNFLRVDGRKFPMLTS